MASLDKLESELVELLKLVRKVKKEQSKYKPLNYKHLIPKNESDNKETIIDKMNPNIIDNNVELVPEIRGRLDVIYSDLNSYSELISLCYEKLYKANLLFDNNIKKYRYLLSGGLYKNVNAAGLDEENLYPINILCVNKKEDIIEDFRFVYVLNINEFVIKIKNKYINFKLEQVMDLDDKNIRHMRLENCIYGNKCNKNCCYYHNPIDNTEKIHSNRMFYPTYSIKSCPRFGDKTLLKHQIKQIKYEELLDAIQKSCFLILATRFIVT